MGTSPVRGCINGHTRRYTLHAQCRPRRPFKIDSIPALRQRISAYLITLWSGDDQSNLIPTRKIHTILDTAKVEVWGKLRRTGGGDTMLASKVVTSNAEDRRDATWVRVRVLITYQISLPNETPSIRFLSTKMQAMKTPHLPSPTTSDTDSFTILSCLPSRRSSSRGSPSFQSPPLSSLLILRLARVQQSTRVSTSITTNKWEPPKLLISLPSNAACLIGRVEWKKGNGPGMQWAIIDRSGPLARVNEALV